MRFPAFLERCSDGSYGVGFPDVLGCVSAGGTVEEAIENAAEALTFHLEGMLEDGDPLPRPGDVDRHRGDPGWAGADLWVIVEVDPPRVASKASRLNVTLPERMVASIDAAAQREGLTRSGWLQKAAVRSLARGGAVRATTGKGSGVPKQPTGPARQAGKKAHPTRV